MTAINFNSIYTTYYRRAFLFTLSYVHNDLVAEDIVSEAIIYLWELSKKQEIPSIEAVLITYIRRITLKGENIVGWYAGKDAHCIYIRSSGWKIS